MDKSTQFILWLCGEKGVRFPFFQEPFEIKEKVMGQEIPDHDHKDEACSVCPKVGVDVAEREEE